MVPYHVKKMIITCSPILRHLFDIITVVSTGRAVLNIVPLEYKCLKMLETGAIHLKLCRAHYCEIPNISPSEILDETFY